MRLSEWSKKKMTLHHIGLVVDTLEKSVALYEMLGYRRKTDPIYDERQHIWIVFMEKEGESPMIELIEPIDERSSVHCTGLGYHHMCYEWRDERNFEDVFRSWKIGKRIAGPFSAVALDGRSVVFCCLTNMTLIEFIL